MSDAMLKAMVVSAREAALEARLRTVRAGLPELAPEPEPEPGDLVVEMSMFGLDPDAIGLLVGHGSAPWDENAAPGAPEREVWDIRPLNPRAKTGTKGAEKGVQRWENARFLRVPVPPAVLNELQVEVMSRG